jgi:predicted phosphodiesterase
MFFIGDIHGDFDRYYWLIDHSRRNAEGFDQSIQIGDTGVFYPNDLESLRNDWNHKFFRGNHDNPEIYHNHPCAMDDYGFHKGMFWLGGGYSIDQNYRTPGLNWWPDEEISYLQILNAIEMYSNSKPNIMVSHECPTIIKSKVLTNKSKASVCSKTESALQSMYDIHSPDVWIFGHHHKRIETKISNTLFIGLGDSMSKINDQWYEIDDLSW